MLLYRMKTKKLAKLPLFVTRGKDRFFVYKNKRYRIESTKSNDKIIAEMLKIIKILSNNEKRSNQRYKSKFVRKQTLKKQKESGKLNADDPVITSNPVSQNDFIKYWLQNSSTKIEPVNKNDLINTQKTLYGEYAKSLKDLKADEYKQYQEEQRLLNDERREQNRLDRATLDKLIDTVVRTQQLQIEPNVFNKLSGDQQQEITESRIEINDNAIELESTRKELKVLKNEVADLKKEKVDTTGDVQKIIYDKNESIKKLKKKEEELKQNIKDIQIQANEMIIAATAENEHKLMVGQQEAEKNAAKIIQEAKDESNKLKEIELSGIREEKEKLQIEVTNLTFRIKANKIKSKTALRTQERELKEKAELQERALEEVNATILKEFEKKIKDKEKNLGRLQETINGLTIELQNANETLNLKKTELIDKNKEIKKVTSDLEINQGLVKSTQAQKQKIELEAMDAKIRQDAKNAQYEKELIEKQEQAKAVQATAYKAIQEKESAEKIKEAAEKETKKIKEAAEKFKEAAEKETIKIKEAALKEATEIKKEKERLTKQLEEDKKKTDAMLKKTRLKERSIAYDDKYKVLNDKYESSLDAIEDYYTSGSHYVKLLNSKTNVYDRVSTKQQLLKRLQKYTNDPKFKGIFKVTDYYNFDKTTVGSKAILNKIYELEEIRLPGQSKEEIRNSVIRFLYTNAKKYPDNEETKFYKDTFTLYDYDNEYKKLSEEYADVIEDNENNDNESTNEPNEIVQDVFEDASEDILTEPKEIVPDPDPLDEVSIIVKPVSDYTDNTGASSSGSGNMKGGLYNYEINEMMKKYKGFLGAYAIDQLNLLKPKSINFSFIMNTKPIKIKHGHWVALFISPDTIEYYDSLAEEPNRRLVQLLKPILNKHGKKGNIWQYKINSVKLQKSTTDTCGYFAMKFITDRYNGKTFKQATRFKTIEDSVKGEKDVNKFKSMIKDFGYVK